MTKAQRELEEASLEWLEALKGHNRYLAATERLFKIYSSSWYSSRRNLSESFTEFREALLRESGYSHQQVKEVFPTQRPESK